jgi:hypothetical protein
MEMNSLATQGLYELINVGCVLLTCEEVTSLVQKFDNECKPPFVFFRCGVANVLLLEGVDMILPGVQVEKSCNVV